MATVISVCTHELSDQLTLTMSGEGDADPSTPITLKRPPEEIPTYEKLIHDAHCSDKGNMLLILLPTPEWDPDKRSMDTPKCSVCKSPSVIPTPFPLKLDFLEKSDCLMTSDMSGSLFDTGDSDTSRPASCSSSVGYFSEHEPAHQPSTSDEEELQKYIYIPENLQYFLASVCELRPIEDFDFRFGLRHPHTPEVRRLLRRLEKCKLSESDLQNTHPNAIVSVMKELLSSLPPLFEHEEFVCLSADCSDDLVKCYIRGLIDSLCNSVRQLGFLAANAIGRLVQIAGNGRDAFTDAVMLFTPLFFPSCINRAASFVRASRATLMLIQNSEELFSSYLAVDRFYTELFGSLNRLHESITRDSEGDSDQSSDMEHYDEIRLPAMSESQHYYTLTFEEE